MFFVDVVASGLHAAREKWQIRDGRWLILREREAAWAPRSRSLLRRYGDRLGAARRGGRSREGHSPPWSGYNKFNN